MKKKWISQVLLILFLLPVIGFAGWCGYNVTLLSKERTEIKKDYSELNNIQHGLLSVNAWRDHVGLIVSQQIDEFDLSKMQEDTLKTELNKILNSVITKAEEMINEKKENVSFKNKVKNYAARKFINIDKVRETVPEFSQTIIDELKKNSSKERLKFIAKDKFDEFAQKTHDSLSSSADIEEILCKYGASNNSEFNELASLRVEKLQEETYQYSYGIIASLIFILLLWLLLMKKVHVHTPLFILSVLLALITLVVGLMAPMIEIDARIKELNFLLIGTPLVFQDQVIFYQSKSILDVVHILISTHKADSVLVGVLILIFSVVFPITKLISTEIYLLGSEKVRSGKFLRFFVFKSGKWSMADVMVVAIFMAYIGFKGIMDGQMEQLNVNANGLATIATNETNLQPGVILFVSYVLFGLILAVILKKITLKEKFLNIPKLQIGRSRRIIAPPELPKKD